MTLSAACRRQKSATRPATGTSPAGAQRSSSVGRDDGTSRTCDGSRHRVRLRWLPNRNAWCFLGAPCCGAYQGRMTPSASIMWRRHGRKRDDAASPADGVPAPAHIIAKCARTYRRLAPSPFRGARQYSRSRVHDGFTSCAHLGLVREPWGRCSRGFGLGDAGPICHPGLRA